MTPSRSRLGAVDLVRGAAIVLMALDHTRDYTTALRFQPENLALSSLLLFLTRAGGSVAQSAVDRAAETQGVAVGIADVDFPHGAA